MPEQDILEQRRLARQQKSERDAQLFRLHEVAADAMAGFQAQQVRQRALEQVEKWEKGALCSHCYIAEWRRMLDLPPAALRQAMLRDGGEGVALRQNTPFGFLVRG